MNFDESSYSPFCFAEMCHAYLMQLYQNPAQVEKQVTFSLEGTQGDVLPQSVSTLLSQVQLSNEDVFIDFGSGRGQVIFHVFLLSSVKKLIGIEIQEPLHQYAMQLKNQLLQEVPLFFGEKRTIQLIHGNFLEQDVGDATVAFISAVCFSQATLIALAKQLNRLPYLRKVLSLKPLTHLTILPFEKAIRVQCSWGSALCYCYGPN
jgi:hypothetical protein